MGIVRRFGLFGVVGVVISFFLYRLMSGGGGEVTPETTADVVTSTRFWVLFILGAVVLVVWAVANYVYRPALTYPTGQRLRGAIPPVWAFAILLGIPTFHWLFWAVSPGVWSSWLSSQAFWPMNVAIVLAAFFASQGGLASRYTGFALLALLVVAVGIGVYERLPIMPSFLSPTPATSSGGVRDITLTLRPGKPGRISVPPGYRWHMAGSTPARGWVTDDGYRDKRGNRIQVFNVVPPATEVTIEVRIRKCATAQECVW